jgi:hypothetical protein
MRSNGAHDRSMRRSIMLFVVAACGEGSYGAEPRAVESECSTLDCPLAAGGEVLVDPVFYGDVLELIGVTDAWVTPAGVADVQLVGNVIVVHPHAPPAVVPQSGGGGPVLGYTAERGGTFEFPISIAAIATTTVAPYEWELPSVTRRERLFAGNRMAAFVGDSLAVVAQHRAANGQRLLGHGFEHWSITGPGELIELSGDVAVNTDVALIRRVHATSAGQLAIDVGGAPFVVDVVPPRSTARLELGQTSVGIMVNEMTSVAVAPFTADDHYIHGGTITVTIDDPSVASADVSGSRNAVQLVGLKQGSTTATITVDGTSATLPIDVD